eukprot:1397631-Prymnesium_polylepis.1
MPPTTHGNGHNPSDPIEFIDPPLATEIRTHAPFGVFAQRGTAPPGATLTPNRISAGCAGSAVTNRVATRW